MQTPDTSHAGNSQVPDDPPTRFLIPAQHATTVTVDERGDVVIEQGDAIGNEPAVIVIARHNVERLIAALVALNGARPAATASRQPDPTNADRQRRYRQRHNNGDGSVTRPVTPTTNEGSAQPLG